MRRILSAALVYALIVFAIGFGLGTLRNLVLIPLVGVLPAVLIELPFMLAACWFVARWVVAHKQVPAQAVLRLGMGAGALVILTGLEALTAFLLFGLPLSLFFSGYLTLPGLAGLSGQLIFAAIPALLLLARR
ncbi:hypothetical protein [Antarctobacter jejuensis]|uniref:hypothetical protein n=1 Tax=Antarctobacter jejuensis TaxID=1439938 RepID=UPI003FD0D0B5